MKIERASRQDFAKRAASKAKARAAMDRALASGKVSRADLVRKNAHFSGMKVCLELARAKALA